MARLEVDEVQIVLKNGKVLNFKESLGDVVVVSEIRTQPTGTPANAPMTIHYYNAMLVPVADVQKDR